MASKKERKEEKELKNNVGDNSKETDHGKNILDKDQQLVEEETAKAQQTEETKEKSKKVLIEEFNKKLAEKEQELKELKNKYLMALAEIENMRKKMLRDKQSFYRSGIKDMALSVLQIMDDIERAIEQIESAKDIEAVREGVLLIHRKFKQMLEARQIKPIESKGQPFNPDLHEALMKIETDREQDHMKVIDELQKGYMIGDEVLRHSRVVVAVKKQEEAKSEKTSGEKSNNKDTKEASDNNDGN